MNTKTTRKTTTSKLPWMKVVMLAIFVSVLDWADVQMQSVVAAAVPTPLHSNSHHPSQSSRGHSAPQPRPHLTSRSSAPPASPRSGYTYGFVSVPKVKTKTGNAYRPLSKDFATDVPRRPGFGYGPFGGIFGPGPVLLNDQLRGTRRQRRGVGKRAGGAGVINDVAGALVGVVTGGDRNEEGGGNDDGEGDDDDDDDDDDDAGQGEGQADAQIDGGEKKNGQVRPQLENRSSKSALDNVATSTLANPYWTRAAYDPNPTYANNPAPISTPTGTGTGVVGPPLSTNTPIGNAPIQAGPQADNDKLFTGERGVYRVLDDPKPTGNVVPGDAPVDRNMRYGYGVPYKGYGPGEEKDKKSDEKKDKEKDGKKDDGKEDKGRNSKGDSQDKKGLQKQKPQDKQDDKKEHEKNKDVVKGDKNTKPIDYTHDADYDIPANGIGQGPAPIKDKPIENQPQGNAKPSTPGDRPQTSEGDDDEDCEDEEDPSSPASTATPTPPVTPGAPSANGHSHGSGIPYDYRTGRYGHVGYAENFYSQSNSSSSKSSSVFTSKTTKIDAKIDGKYAGAADSNSGGRGRNGTEGQVQAHAQADMHQEQHEEQSQLESQSTNASRASNATLTYGGQASVVGVDKPGQGKNTTAQGKPGQAKGAKLTAEGKISTSSSTTTVMNTTKTSTKTTTMRYDVNLKAAAVNGTQLPVAGEPRTRPRPNGSFFEGNATAHLDINKSSSNSTSFNATQSQKVAANRMFGLERTSFVGTPGQPGSGQPGQQEQPRVQGQVTTTANISDSFVAENTSSTSAQISKTSNQTLNYAAHAAYSSGSGSGSSPSARPQNSTRPSSPQKPSYQYTASGTIDSTSDSSVSVSSNNSTRFNATSEVKSSASAVLTGSSSGKKIDYTHDMPDDYYGGTHPNSGSAGSSSDKDKDSKDTSKSSSKNDQAGHQDSASSRSGKQRGDYEKTNTNSAIKIDRDKSGTGYTVSQTVDETETVKSGNITATRFGQTTSTFHSMGSIAAGLAAAGGPGPGAGAGPGTGAVISSAAAPPGTGAGPATSPRLTNIPVRGHSSIPFVPQHRDSHPEPGEARLSYICEKRYVHVKLSPEALKKRTIDFSRVVGKRFQENGPRSQEEVTALITKAASAGGLSSNHFVLPDEKHEKEREEESEKVSSKDKRHVVDGESRTKDGGREYAIWTRLCVPKGFVGEVEDDGDNKNNKSDGKGGILEFTIHGINFDQNYWSFGGRGSPYNYLETAIRAGHAVFTFDRLGVGRSDKPINGIADVQRGIEVEVAAELLKYLHSHKKYKFDTVIGVGHSFGSSQLVGLATEYGNLFDAMVLTGFTSYGGGLPATLTGWGLRIASERLPKRFGPLPRSYLVTGGLVNDQTTFFNFPYYDFEVLLDADKTRQTVTIGEILTLPLLEPAPAYQKPLLVVTGDKDFIFCGGNCFQHTNLNNAPNLVAGTRSLFPNVKRFDTYIPPHTGHGVNLHYGAEITFAVIQKWLKTVL